MSVSEYVSIFASTRKNVLTYMSACFPLLVECVGISVCWHICQNLDVSAYTVGTLYNTNVGVQKIPDRAIWKPMVA